MPMPGGPGCAKSICQGIVKWCVGLSGLPRQSTTDWLPETREIYSLTVLEARSLTKVWTGLFLSEGVKEVSLRVSFLASGGLLPILGVSWLVEASPLYLPSLSHGSVFFGACLRHWCSFYKDVSHVGSGPIPLSYDFILTNYICDHSISK